MKMNNLKTILLGNLFLYLILQNNKNEIIFVDN